MSGLEAIAIGWFYLGFAGVAGSLFCTHPFGRGISWVMLLLLLLYSLALPYPWPYSAAIWIAAGGVTVRYAGFPRALPPWAQSPRFILGYFAVAMILVSIWAVFSAQTVLLIGVGIPAVCAGLVLSIRAYSLGSGAV